MNKRNKIFEQKMKGGKDLNIFENWFCHDIK